MNLIVKQPNGLFAIFLTSDCRFTHFNLTEIEVEIYSRETFHLSRHQVIDDIKMAKLSGSVGWRECMEAVERRFGSGALWDVENMINQPRQHCIFLWMETAQGYVLQSAGINEEKEIDQWVDFQCQRFHLSQSPIVKNAWLSNNHDTIYFHVAIDGKIEKLFQR